MLNKKILSTTTHRTLAFFCLHPEQKFHGREIARQMKERTSSVQRVLKILEAEGVLIPERKGRMIFYTLDESNPLVRPFKVLAVVAALEPLIRKLRGITDLVVVYGSSSRGTYLTDSDVDLFIITNHEDEVFDAVSKFSRGFPKEIKPVIHSLAEWVDIEGKNQVFSGEIAKGFVLHQSEYYESRI
jgi:predicted nucleotidyltransferase